MKTPDFKKQYQDAVKQLEQLRDEIRLEIHLAGMDVQTRFQELEGRFKELESRAKVEVNDTTRHAADELVVQFQKVQASLKKAAGTLRRATP